MGNFMIVINRVLWKRRGTQKKWGFCYFQEQIAIVAVSPLYSVFTVALFPRRNSALCTAQLLEQPNNRDYASNQSA